VNQDYVYNWTRDSAIVAMELEAGPLHTSQPLADYVQFAQTCQNSASGIGHFGRASFLIDGSPRDWSDQTDGPALQTLAILQMYARLDTPIQAVASAVIAANLDFPAERLPRRDLQPLGRGIRRLVLRALGPAEML
jgi:glucoamylase